MRAKPLARRPVRTFTVPGKSPPVPGAPPRPRCAPAFLWEERGMGARRRRGLTSGSGKGEPGGDGGRAGPCPAEGSRVPGALRPPRFPVLPRAMAAGAGRGGAAR